MSTPTSISASAGRVVRYALIGVAAAWFTAWLHAAIAPPRTTTEVRAGDGSQLIPFSRVKTSVLRVDPFTGDSRGSLLSTGVDVYGWPFASMSAQFQRVDASEHPTFDVVAGVRLPGFRKSGVAFVRRALPVIPEPGFLVNTLFYGAIAGVAARVLRVDRAHGRVERCTLCMHELTGDGVCEQCGWVRDQLLADGIEPRAAKHAG